MATKYGTNGADFIYGTNEQDFYYGYGGNDTLTGVGGDDILFGDAGNDILSGGAGHDYLVGGDGNDIVDGGSGTNSMAYYGSADVLINMLTGVANEVGHGVDTFSNIEGFFLGSGDNSVIGNNQANHVYSGSGEDVVYGGGGNDTISTAAGNDIISGGAGNDDLYGGADDDTLYGGSGNDDLDGGAGVDTMTGDGGADDFEFHAGDSGVGAGNRDEITDFSKAQNDDIDLSSFGGLDFIGTAGFSAAGQVRFWHSGGDTIVAINTAGNTGAEMQIELSGVINLAAGDFLL